MCDPQSAAAALGIRVKLEDLGDWQPATLVSEYDPAARAIRINLRALAAYRSAGGESDSDDVRSFVDFAVAHELYHHAEAAGTQPRLPTRQGREAAADAHARALVPVSARLEAFLRGAIAR